MSTTLSSRFCINYKRCSASTSRGATRVVAIARSQALRNRTQLRSIQPQHIRRASAERRNVGVSASTAPEDTVDDELARPNSAQMVRNIMEISPAGTLATVTEDGWPLGTYMPFVLNSNADPILKLRSSAIHTKNLMADPRCSLYVRTEFGARASLIGRVVTLDQSEESAALIAAFAERHGQDYGIDALAEDDTYCRLEVESIFYVAGLGMEKVPETVEASAYSVAEVDAICSVAQSLVHWMNAERSDELKRCAAVFAGLDDVVSAKLLWVDSVGCDMRAILKSGAPREVRLPFARPVIDERDARSALTMLGQLAWELERNYQPATPEPVQQKEK
mmetsp:Transcript_34420/g.65773  ORF Transcript_34420/g.65773 Transcript_34420/m.65773 type:complete len:335 (-) Transcript_34420:487-1491(-)